MNKDKYKTIEIEGRRFQISKYSAKTGLKVTKMLISKLMPVAQPLLSAMSGDVALDGTAPNEEGSSSSWKDVLSNLSFEKISRALDLVSDDELDRLVDCSLSQCLEILPAGIVPIINKNGTFAAAGIEDDLLLTIRLTAEVIMWSVAGFFGGNRLTSVLSPLMGSSLPGALM